MRTRASFLPPTASLLLAAGLILGLTGCGPKEAPAAAAPAPKAAPKPEPAPAPQAPDPKTSPSGTRPAAPVAAHPAQAAPVPAPAAPAPSASPAPAAAPASAPVQAPAPAPKPAPPAPAMSPVTDPGGEVAVKATAAGATRVGAAACKLCHKVQFASWTETAHGKRTPPLDCEGCHGPGSAYKSMAIMKDAEKAKAAGLVMPGAAFCATCHKRGWNDGMLKKAHAHKA